MRKMENYTYKRWTKMWRLWTHHRLNSPLEELVTYDNYMTHGHLYYFQYLKNDYDIKRNIWIIKKYLSNEMIQNLNKAYQIYQDNLELINNKKLSDLELENLFMEVDEAFYDDSYEMTKIIMKELSDYTDIKIFNFRKRNEVIRKLRSSKKS